jgi:hypothetical protein
MVDLNQLADVSMTGYRPQSKAIRVLSNQIKRTVTD